MKNIHPRVEDHFNDVLKITPEAKVGMIKIFKTAIYCMLWQNRYVTVVQKITQTVKEDHIRIREQWLILKTVQCNFFSQDKRKCRDNNDCIQNMRKRNHLYYDDSAQDTRSIVLEPLPLRKVCVQLSYFRGQKCSKNEPRCL